MENNIIKKILFTSISSIILSTTTYGNQVHNIISNTEINNNILNKLELSKKLIGKIEFQHFLKYFKIEHSTNKIIYSKIKSFTSDGVLGPIALKKIYTEVYSNDLENCSEEIQKRWEVYLEMKKYKTHKSRLGYKPNLSKLNVFKYEFYYGNHTLGINKKGTNINEKLIGIIPEKIKYKGPKIIIKNYNGKTTLSYYEKGNLLISTYISPGRLNSKSYSNKKIVHKPILNRYYISSSSKRPGSIMPYAIKVAGGIYIHGSDHHITGLPASGGCYRTPARFIKPLFEYIKNQKKYNLVIEIKDIY